MSVRARHSPVPSRLSRECARFKRKSRTHPEGKLLPWSKSCSLINKFEHKFIFAYLE
jgi:hypothetical protein